MTFLEFTGEHDLAKHYAAVHARLWPPVPLAPRVAPRPVKPPEPTRAWSSPRVILIPDASTNSTGFMDEVFEVAISWLATRPQPIVIATVRTAFLRATGISEERFCSRAKTYPLVTYRLAAMVAARMLTTGSLQRIARAFGRSDHTSVLYAQSVMGDRVSLLLMKHDLLPWWNRPVIRGVKGNPLQRR